MNLVKTQKRDLISYVKRRRGIQLKDAGVTEEQLDQLFNGNYFTAHQAKEMGICLIKLGLVDRIGTFEELNEEKFGNYRVHEVHLGKTKGSPSFYESFVNASAQWSSLASNINTISSLNSTDLEVSNIETAVDTIIQSLSPEQITDLVTELVDYTTEISHNNLTNSLI